MTSFKTMTNGGGTRILEFIQFAQHFGGKFLPALTKEVKGEGMLIHSTMIEIHVEVPDEHAEIFKKTMEKLDYIEKDY